jgi:GntR family transcriptional regulator
MATLNFVREINRDNPIPLYYQVAHILRKEIESGTYSPGEYIPTELELEKRFGVSRITIRQAIADLVQHGLVERWRSKGTRVSSSRIETNLLDLASFTNEVVNSGRNLTTQIIDFAHIPAPEYVAGSLELDPGESVVAMERIRYLDGAPIAVGHWYAPDRYFPGLDSSMFGTAGIEQSAYYVLLHRYGIEINKAIDTVSSLAIDARDARLLKVAKKTPVLKRTRISYTANNRPVTFGYGIYLIKLRFVMEAKRSGSNIHHEDSFIE